MTSLSSNLKTLMSLARINASELARRTEVAQPIIHRLSTGQNLNPKLATVKPIAKYFMVTVSQLIGEDLLPTDKTFYKVSSSHRGWSRLPLITWRDAIRWPEPLAHYQESRDAVYVSTDANVSEYAYSLQIKGSAMEPLFPAGTSIVADPDRPLTDRAFVVVSMNDEPEARLKQILIDGADSYLKSLNPELDEHKIKKLSSSDRVLAVMVQAKVDFN